MTEELLEEARKSMADLRHKKLNRRLFWIALAVTIITALLPLFLGLPTTASKIAGFVLSAVAIPALLALVSYIIAQLLGYIRYKDWSYKKKSNRIWLTIYLGIYAIWIIVIIPDIIAFFIALT